ncbi:MAG TPA: Ku protein [Fimbriiglobus sp.]|jgi:DNA end-binding protein Ku
MALRTSWVGYLRLSLISVPVKAYSAVVSGGGRIGFHQLCHKCHSRIRYQKVCPIHGVLTNEQIVSGYEVAKGQYSVIDKKELAKLQPEADKAINIDVFVRPDAIDPVYFTDRTYYLTPDRKAGKKPFAVLRQVMADAERQAVARMVLSGREQVVLIRPVDKLLAVAILNYESQLKNPSTFADEVGDVSVPGEEVKLAKTLIETATVEEFDITDYQDEYAGKLLKFLESKGSKKTVSSRAADEGPAVIAEAGGNIWLTVGLTGNEVELAVRDDGIGIAAEMLPRVLTCSHKSTEPWTVHKVVSVPG